MQLEIVSPPAGKRGPHQPIAETTIARVLDYVRAHIRRTEGVPPHIVMSEQLQIGAFTLRTALKELDGRKVMLFERAHGMTRYRIIGEGVTPWFITSSTTHKKLHENPGTIAMRKCLRCGKPFRSAHKGNRLCGCPE